MPSDKDIGEKKAFEPWRAFPATLAGDKWRCWVGHKWPELTCGELHNTQTVADRCADRWVKGVNVTHAFTCDDIAHDPLLHFIVPDGSLRINHHANS